jgi:MtN3 and saliva related transmembrane protein
MSIEIEIVAFIASTIGVSGCIPQIHKILKTKDTEAISYGKYIMCALSSFLWIYYGTMVGTYSIVFWNIFSIVMAVSVIMLKYNQERKKTPTSHADAFDTKYIIDN